MIRFLSLMLLTIVLNTFNLNADYRTPTEEKQHFDEGILIGADFMISSVDYEDHIPVPKYQYLFSEDELKLTVREWRMWWDPLIYDLHKPFEQAFSPIQNPTFSESSLFTDERFMSKEEIQQHFDEGVLIGAEYMVSYVEFEPNVGRIEYCRFLFSEDAMKNFVQCLKYDNHIYYIQMHDLRQ